MTCRMMIVYTNVSIYNCTSIHIYIYTEVYTGASYTRMYVYLHICIHTRTALSGRPAQRPLRGWGCAPASGSGHLPLHRLGSRNRRSQKIQILVALLKDFVSDPPDFDLSLPWRPMKGFLCKSMLARCVRPIWGRSFKRTQSPTAYWHYSGSAKLIYGCILSFLSLYFSKISYVFLEANHQLQGLGFRKSGI